MTVASALLDQLTQSLLHLPMPPLDWRHPVVVACSGGVDSTALVVLAAVRRDQVAPFIVAYVDHRTRAESGAEGQLVADLCYSLGVPCVRTTVEADWTPGDHVAEHRLRHARFRALARVAAAFGLNSVVTAHTLDDQVETVLLRILSGTSGQGASGMRSDSTVATDFGPLRVLRPLLSVSRRELDDVLSAAAIVPAIDPTNADPRYRRSVLRHQVIPILQREFPGFPQTLLRSTSLNQLDAEVVDALADDAYRRLAGEGDHTVVLERGPFGELRRAIATRVVIAAARQVSDTMQTDSRELSTERINAVVDAARGRTGALIQLPYGVDVRIERTRLSFTRRLQEIADE